MKVPVFSQNGEHLLVVCSKDPNGGDTKRNDSDSDLDSVSDIQSHLGGTTSNEVQHCLITYKITRAEEYLKFMDDKEKDQEVPLDNQKDHAERIIDIDQAY